MSLVVWLPLNGNLENQGLSNVTVINNGATVDDNGKIGKCYKFNNQYMTIPMTNLNTTNGLTLACWVYPIANASGNMHLVTFAPGAGWPYNRFGLFLRSGTTSIITTASDGTNTINYNCQSSALPLNTWTHVCSTYSNRKLTVYLNGVQNITYNITFDISLNGIDSLNVGGCKNGNETLANCKLNDVRFYNHCLSAKEVKELAKGLVLHYRLAGPGQSNLMPNTSNKIQSTNVTTNYNILYSISGSQMEKGAKYVYSGYFENTGTKIIRLRVQWFNSGSDRGGPISSININPGDKGFYYLPFTYPNGTYSTLQLGMDGNSNTAITSSTYNYAFVKLERGSVQTPWCPNPADSLYSTLGYNNNIEYDCSGYRRNGTKSGTITWDIDSPRYTTSYNYTDSETSIKLGDLSTIIPEGIFTFNIWFKKETNKWSSKAYETILGGPGGFELETKNSTSNSPIIFAYSWGNGAINYTLDTWHMLTMVRTSVDTKFYLDGELKLTGSAGTIPAGNYFIGAWRSALEQNYRGLLADARIYVTELSAEDIAELYHSAVIVDNTGKNYAYEYFEAN